jgi:uncharacterized protein
MGVELRPFGVACNLACTYCYQNPMRAAGNFRQTYSMDKMKAALERAQSPFILFGGEPLLMPLEDLEEIFAFGFERHGSNGIQTNGALINDAHIDLFRRYNVEVGVSIDGPGSLNDVRVDRRKSRTRETTATIESNIERLCREHRPPGLIVTLHQGNARADRLPTMYAWMRRLDALGIRGVRLHVLEVEDPGLASSLVLSPRENVEAILGFARLQEELSGLTFDIVEEMKQLLLGNDANAACVWHACDPYSTRAVRGVEGNGQSSNCGRTNKDGIDYLPADRGGFERTLALYHTEEMDGGCKGCRFFLMCKGQCPGTAIGGDWRNRSEHCSIWKYLFATLEKQLIGQGQVPLSIDLERESREAAAIERWSSQNQVEV